MAKTESFSLENDLGCGLFGAFFQRGGSKLRKAYSVPSLPGNRSNKENSEKQQSGLDSKKRRGSVCDVALFDSSKPAKHPPKLVENTTPRRASLSPRCSTVSRDQNLGRRHSTSSLEKAKVNETSQVVISDYTRRLRKEPSVTSGELSLTVAALPKSNSSETLNRASTGNIMLLGHLGNLKQQANKKQLNNNTRALDKSPRTLRRDGNLNVLNGSTLIMGNILKKPAERNQQFSNMYGGVMNKEDPELLKSMGNQKYKEGRLEEALALYNQAIALDSSKAAYFSNKSAALIGLGHLTEAVFECQEAIRIEPNYHNAHHRLAKLYLRLGEAEKALRHLNHSGHKASNKDMTEAQALKNHLSKCTEAQELKDWTALLTESQQALSSGADTAPQIYAMKAEALMKLHKHEEAYATVQRCPTFGTELCTRLFGAACTAYSLIIQSQVYMAAGRFEDAVAAALNAARLDSSDGMNILVKKVQAVMKARSNGNWLYKASRFSEACVAYTEGLDIEPFNSVLLCNRAACRSKLRQYEKAVEDCTMALNVYPSYTKARLRRADCNAKMERWKAAIQDYEVLLQGNYEDEELHSKLMEANLQLHKQHNGGSKDPENLFNLTPISSYKHLRHLIDAPANVAASKC